jgi:FtsH-binding integral membrane protein
MLINPETGSRKALGWVVMLAPLGMVLLLGSGLRRFSASTMTLLFIVFSALMGMSISYIFVAYSLGSITSTFFISATMFGVMALVGYTTKTDLSKLGSLLFMGLIGIIIASIINYFLGSATFDYIISFIGVLIFTGLTAYDMQKVKQIGMQLDSESEEGKKAAIMGALSLYLDFINLFLFLLRFFGNRD